MADFESSSNFKGILQRSFIRGFLSGLLKNTIKIANTICNELCVKAFKLVEFLSFNLYSSLQSCLQFDQQLIIIIAY